MCRQIAIDPGSHKAKGIYGYFHLDLDTPDRFHAPSKVPLYRPFALILSETAPSNTFIPYPPNSEVSYLGAAMKPSHQWTLGGELIKLSGRDSLREAMVALNLATPLGGQVHLLDEKSLWQRAGSESYIYRFAITQDDKTTQCLIKACVGYSPTNNLNALLESWVSRRRVLDEHGISTPVLFGWGKGELVEEYVPYSLAEVLTKKNNAMEQILDLLATYAGVLSSLGFSPICPFRDLRSRGEDVVVIDFGEDLGPPGVFTKKRSVVFDMLQTYLRGFYLQLSDDVIDRLRSRFAANGGEFLH